jgi:DNA polymerase-1
MKGDSIDCYPGIKGVGDVTINDILLSPHRLRKTTFYTGKRVPKLNEKWVKGEPCSVWQSMIDYAARAGMTEADLIVQAQLARILRHGDYDPTTRTVQLWTPNGNKEMKL